MLSQVVSPGASTYLYDCCLRPDDVEFKAMSMASVSVCVRGFVGGRVCFTLPPSPCCAQPTNQENRPYVGLLRLPSGGFTLVEAFLDAKTLKV